MRGEGNWRGRSSSLGGALSFGGALAVAGALLLCPTSPLCSTRVARAQTRPDFGPHDVRTIFHIAKSDDRNRVDYAISLDAQCQPSGDAPIYAYWHRFEPDEPRYGELNPLDQQIYGIEGQAVRTRSPSGTWVELRVRAFRSLRILVLVQRTEHGCVARAQIPVNGQPAFVDRVFAQLSGPFGVEHVTFRGVDVQTGQPVAERRRP